MQRVPEIQLLPALNELRDRAIRIERQILATALIYERADLLPSDWRPRDARHHAIAAAIRSVEQVNLLTVFNELQRTDTLQLAHGVVYLSETTTIHPLLPTLPFVQQAAREVTMLWARADAAEQHLIEAEAVLSGGRHG